MPNYYHEFTPVSRICLLKWKCKDSGSGNHLSCKALYPFDLG